MGMFIDKDGPYPYCRVPFLNLAYNEVWATEGHVIIRISPERLEDHYEPIQRLTDLKLPKMTKRCQLSCTLTSIRQALDACPLATEKYKKKCKECNGTGEVKWKYTDGHLETHYNYFNCPVCDGEGVVWHKKEIHTGKKAHDENAIVRMGKLNFRWYFLDTVAKALEYIGADVVDITEDKRNYITEFVFDGIKIDLAGLYDGDGEDMRVDAEIKLSKKHI